MVAATSWEGTPPSTNTAPAATAAAETSAVVEDGSSSVCVDEQRAPPHPSISLRDLPPHDACRSLTLSSSSSTGTSTAIPPQEEATRRRRRRSRSGDGSKDGTSFDELTQNAPMSWERQGSSIHPEHIGGSAGNGDSSDTLGDDSDDEELDEEGEIVVAVAAAAAAAAAAGGTTTPGVEGLSINLGGLEGLGASAFPVTYGYCNSKSPVSRVASPVAALSSVDEIETPCPLLGAVTGRSPVGSRLVMPSILPHPEALPFIRERSQQLYVPLPVAISRTFGEENNSMIDRRAWLEVEDRKHRYAKNLRLYYKEWDRRGQPGKSFWSWLDEGDVE
eukprot:evm.model.NODE_17518_length_20738_cov_21.086555.1